MATSFAFGNRIVKIPGSYSIVKSGVKNSAAGLDYGALLVIDTGSMATWGGGSGVLGENNEGKDSVYTFDNIQDARNFIKGGLWFDLMPLLFRPSELGIAGISSVSFVRAAETTSADIAYTFTGGGANGGTITFSLKEEGIVGNGIIDSGQLQRGFAGRMVAGTMDPAKFKIQFFQGTFRGLDYAGEPIGGLSAVSSREQLILETTEFDNITQLGTWAQVNGQMNQLFTTVFAAAGTGLIDAADLAASAAYVAAVGGTETYSAPAFTEALESIKDLSADFILADRWGADVLDTENLEILSHIEVSMVLKPDLYVGGYNLRASFPTSITASETFNSDVVTLVHGGIKVPARSGVGFKNSPSIYLAANVLGREAGLAPQIPLTFKGINIQGLTHQLNDSEQELSLDKGVLTVVKVNNSFDVLKGINSLQDNERLLNEDGTSPSKQVKRIVRQMNKELAVLSRAQLLKSPVGVNRNTLSEEDLKAWVESYLLTITATPLADNLILSFEDVNVSRQQDAYLVNYGVVLNTEISFLFFTGTVISI